VTAILAAVMLAIGVAIGAAIGPAPSASFAGARSAIGPVLPLVLRSLAQQRIPAQAQPAATGPAPARTSGARSSGTRGSASVVSPATAPAPTETPPPASPQASPPRPSAGSRPAIAPVTSVWLIELSGSTFAGALAQPSAARFIDGPAITGGTLLGNWSSLDASGFASEAALLAGGPAQLLDSIVQPPCPEGTADAECVPGTPAALAAADSFLRQSVETIQATAAYRAHGLIVITFATVAAAAATGLPAGATSATLTSHPPSGVLLVSPFAAAGSRSVAAFDPTSPRQSVRALLHG
jgi:hypothetical protein